jgi:hypothetical protein
MSNSTEQFNPDGYAVAPDENTPRKASEVLLSLENKVEVLTALVYNQDLLLKLAVDRCNKIYAYIEELKKEYQEQAVAQAKEGEEQEDPRMVMSPPPEQVITDANINEQVGEKRGARMAQQMRQQPIMMPQNREEPQQQPAGQEGRKIPVIQRVSDSTGKDLFLAQVVISDENGKLVHKTKTSAVGKWQCLLKPGVYSIHISKTDTATKKVIEATQQITINNSSSTITLPVAIIKR